MCKVINDCLGILGFFIATEQWNNIAGACSFYLVAPVQWNIEGPTKPMNLPLKKLVRRFEKLFDNPV